MTENKYNGWTNYETWVVNLWMDSDEGSQAYWQEEAQSALDRADADDISTKVENAASTLAEQLKDWHEDRIGDSGLPTASFICDLLGAALSEVNWHEIAVLLLEDYQEEVSA